MMRSLRSIFGRVDMAPRPAASSAPATGNARAAAPGAPPFQERRKDHRDLVDSRRRLQLLLDHMPDGVLAFDARGRVKWINPAGRLMFQCSVADTVGQPVRGLIPELDPTAGKAPREEREGMARAPVPRLSMRGRRRDGDSFPLEVEIVRLHANGEQGGMCVCRDMSQSQHIEHMKHEFVSMVSHELRTPLTSLRGSLALLADGSMAGLPPDALRLLKLASDNAERLVVLVNDILDFEKLRAEALRVDLEPADLCQSAHHAADALEGMARQARVALRVLPSELALPVRADPARLMQVLGNLLSNAIKHSPANGSVEVLIVRRGERARLLVRDQGPGVPSELSPRLFEPFAQARDNQHGRGGTGLGLAISRALMEMMHGAIGVEPRTTGQGACFWIELPLALDRPSTFGNFD